MSQHEPPQGAVQGAPHQICVPVMLIMDVEGVVAPGRGWTLWGDDVTAGPPTLGMRVSPRMCRRLDALGERPGVQAWWLTDWEPDLRRRLTPLPGRDWPNIATRDEVATRTANTPNGPQRHGTPGYWWKWVALSRHLSQTPAAAVVWCDDRLAFPLNEGNWRWRRQEALARLFRMYGIDCLLVAPDEHVGLAPADLDRIEQWTEARSVAHRRTTFR